MSKKKQTRYSGIGGQAVLEGVMMKNKDKYAVAVRKPNVEKDVEVENIKALLVRVSLQSFLLSEVYFHL